MTTKSWAPLMLRTLAWRIAFSRPLLVATATFCVVPFASAAMTPQDAHRELEKLHGDIAAVYKLLPTSYGLDPAAEETAVQKADVKLEETKAKFDPSLQAAPQSYAVVKDGLSRVSRALQGAKIAVTC